MNVATGIGIGAAALGVGVGSAFLMRSACDGWGAHDWTRAYEEHDAWVRQADAKRDGGTLSDDEIAAFIRGLTDGSVTEGQAAAFAMAVFFRGLAGPERIALTRAMTHSGEVLSWDLPGPILDKHSTGGVGDTVSLPLAPMVAACGGYVPMISGRGLGHTGGTLDKLGSIPGYDATPGLDAFRRVVGDVGCAIIGQTADLAPADRRLYAIRDVTGTVESLDLITASILSKKLAAGLDGLVMDVRQGSGAFMATLPDARALAVEVSPRGGHRSAGRRHGRSGAAGQAARLPGGALAAGRPGLGRAGRASARLKAHCPGSCAFGKADQQAS